MKIGIDLLPVRPESSGFRRYSELIIDAIASLNEFDFHIYLNSDMKGLFEAKSTNISVSHHNIGSKYHFVAGQLLLPYRCYSDGLDLIHSPVSPPPLLAPCPTIVTIHDLTFLKYPETMTPLARWYWRLGIRFGIARCARIIVPSESTKEDLGEHYSVSDRKVHVIPELPKNEFFDAIPEKDVILELVGNEDYILYAGTVEPRKNVKLVIESYERARTDYGLEIPLVIAGRLGWRYEHILEAIENSKVKESIILTGHVSDENLRQLYAGATLFVFLSEYEGFGLPPIEAMAAGTPVLVTDRSSLPEVVGDVGVTVSLNDTNEIARRLSALVEDEERRLELSELSYQYATEMMTMDEFAKRLRDVYTNVKQYD